LNHLIYEIETYLKDNLKMSNSIIYTTIGIMSGTSMDGIDISLIDTDGKNLTKILFEKKYQYSEFYKNKLKKLIKNLPKTKKNQLLYVKEKEDFITNIFIKFIKNFINLKKIKNYKIDLIGLSGQTIFHNPEKTYSIQLGSGKKIFKKINIPVVCNFRQNDLLHGGQGAPIGSFYHKSILKKIKDKACIINLGGITNITILINKKLISYDMGPANSLIDDLCKYFYKKNFDKNGSYASKGKLIKHILKLFSQDNYFVRKYPKSLDREYFKSFFNELIKFKANDAIHTASIMTVFSILNDLKFIQKNNKIIILSGGGRKNLFIKRKLHNKLKRMNIKLINIDNYGLDGDMVEAQMFGYLAVRSVKKLHLSTPSTTGVKKAITGGHVYGKVNLKLSYSKFCNQY